jgi:hypothetical protein
VSLTRWRNYPEAGRILAALLAGGFGVAYILLRRHWETKDKAHEALDRISSPAVFWADPDSEEVVAMFGSIRKSRKEAQEKLNGYPRGALRDKFDQLFELLHACETQVRKSYPVVRHLADDVEAETITLAAAEAKALAALDGNHVAAISVICNIRAPKNKLEKEIVSILSNEIRIDD